MPSGRWDSRKGTPPSKPPWARKAHDPAPVHQQVHSRNNSLLQARGVSLGWRASSLRHWSTWGHPGRKNRVRRMPRRGLITGEEIPREDRNTQRGGRKPGLRWSRLSKKTSQRLLKTCAFYFCLQQIAPTFHDDCKPASLWLSVIPDPKSRMSLERFLLEGSWSRRPLRPLLAPHISDFGRPAARTPTSLPAPCPSGALVGHRADATGVSVKSGVAGFENFLATNIHLLLLKTCEGDWALPLAWEPHGQ